MNKALLTGLLLFAPLTTLASAQDAAPDSTFRIAFIQSARLLAAHPAGQKADELTQQAQAELQQISQNVQPLIDKRNAGQQLTADEQDTLELTQRTYQETQQRYQQEIDAAAQPAEQAIDAVIQQVAQEEGYDLVMNYETARTSGLVVYANTDSVPDITEEVITRINAGDAGAGSN